MTTLGQVGLNVVWRTNQLLPSLWNQIWYQTELSAGTIWLRGKHTSLNKWPTASDHFLIFTHSSATMSQKLLQVSATVSLKLKTVHTTHAAHGTDVTIIKWQHIPKSPPEVLEWASSCTGSGQWGGSSGGRPEGKRTLQQLHHRFLHGGGSSSIHPWRGGK